MRIDYIANLRVPTPRAHGFQIFKMCERFAAEGHEVHLIVPCRRAFESERDPFVYYGVEKNFRVIRLWSTDLLGWKVSLGPVSYWVDQISFFFALGIYRTDANLLYTRDPLLLLPFARARHAFGVELHSMPNALARAALGRVRTIFALTTLLKHDLEACGIVPERIAVEPDGVDIEAFQSNENITALRAELRLPAGPLILYTGHLYGWKGADVLAAAAALVPEASFVFVGGIEPELSRFKSRFGGCANVIVLPQRPHAEMPRYMRAADILALPNSARERISTRYTSPLKLFEYMAAGKSIIASDLPSIRDILDDSTAVLVPPDTARAFASGIRALLNDPERRAKLGAAAREKVQSYRWSARARRILNALT